MDILRRVLQDTLDQNSLRLAVVGDNDGTIDVDGAPHRIYARLGSDDGAVIEVHTSTPRALEVGDALYVARENPGSAYGWRMVFWVRAGDRLVDDDFATLLDDDGMELTE